MQTTHHPIPESIQQQARKLRLSGLLSSLPLRLAEAQNHQLSAAQFLELVLQDELNVRHQRELARRQSAASFRESRALEGFDFSFNSSINRQQVYELASCHFIEEKRDAILVGPPGVGKSHIVQALGRCFGSASIGKSGLERYGVGGLVLSFDFSFVPGLGEFLVTVGKDGLCFAEKFVLRGDVSDGGV